jgi:hypothetical protein
LSLYLGRQEVVGGTVLLFGDLVFFRDGDVALGGGVEKEIISYFMGDLPEKTL